MPKQLPVVLFLLLAAATLLPWVSPAVALGTGIAFGLVLGNPFPKQTAKVSGLLLKGSVVGLGFGITLPVVLEAGASGVWITAGGIVLTLAAGLLIGKLFKVEQTTSRLISAGTAICGGSAIAAVGPALGARPESMGVALATVFVLNGVALYLFPPIGHALGLTQQQFGTWAAIAIHDTSSVVGAAATYGPQALALATVLKLTRALWIIPLALLAALVHRREVRQEGTTTAIKWPWFIGFFVAASALRALLPEAVPVFDVVVDVARRGLVLTLFLIGAGLTRATLRAVGMRPLVQGVLLWLLIGSLTLAAVIAWQ